MLASTKLLSLFSLFSLSQGCWEECLSSSELSFVAEPLKSLRELNISNVGGTALVLDATVTENNLDLFRLEQNLAKAIAFAININSESNKLFLGYYSHHNFRLWAEPKSDACTASSLIDSVSLMDTDSVGDDYLGGIVSAFADDFDDFVDASKNKMIVAIMNGPVAQLVAYQVEDYEEEDVRIAMGINGSFNPEGDILYAHPFPEANLQVDVANVSLAADLVDGAILCMQNSCNCH